MRFHIGFSHRISLKTIIWLLGALFVGFCAFLGLSDVAYADSINIAPTSNYYFNPLQPDKITKPISFQSWAFNNTGAYLLSNTSQGANSQNFTYELTGSNLCSSVGGKVATAKVRFLLYDISSNELSSFSISSAYLNGGSLYGSLESPSSGIYYLTYSNFYPNRGFKIIFNSSDWQTINVGSVYLGQTWEYTCAAASDNQDIINNDNQNTTNIINSNAQNTQDIIDNQNTNTQDLIDNQNANNQALIDSQSVCNAVDPIVQTNNSFLGDDGILRYVPTNFGVSKAYSKPSSLSIYSPTNITTMYLCFYPSVEISSAISCTSLTNLPVGSSINIPTNAKYYRYTIDYRSSTYLPILYSCSPGNQAVVDSNNQLNDSLTDDNISGSLNTGNSFFDNFQIDDTRGFSSIIIAPIQFLRDLLTSSGTCSPLSISFNPNDSVHSGSAVWSIPCGDILWSKAPQAVELLWFTLIFGLLGYRVLVDLVRFVNRCLNPEDTSEYIMDL